MSDKIPPHKLLSYGCLAIPLSFAGIAIYINAPDYYATQHGASLTSLGIALLGLRFIDGIQDPFIGFLSDKYHQKRSFIMKLSLTALILSFFLLFYPIGSSYIAWFVLTVFIATTAFSILTINLNSIGAIWSKDKNQKTIVISYREAFGILGLVLAITLPSVLQSNYNKQESFLILSLVLALIIIVTSPIFFMNNKELFLQNRTKQKKFVYPSKISSKAKNLYIIYFISMLAASIPAVLVLFFIRDRLGLEGYNGLFLLTYFVSGAIGMPIWQYISKKHSKEKAWLYSMFLAISVFFWACLLNEGDFWQYLLICFLSGIAFGADLILPHSILADYISEAGHNKYATSYYGTLAFLAKLSLALSAALALPTLEASGFTPAKENSNDALMALSITYGAIPSLIKIFSTTLLWRKVNDKKHYNYGSINNAS